MYIYMVTMMLKMMPFFFQSHLHRPENIIQLLVSFLATILVISQVPFGLVFRKSFIRRQEVTIFTLYFFVKG